MPRIFLRNPMNLIEGFVLAGGQSRRMGQNKAELLLGGRTLIDRAAEALFPIANTVHAVGNLTRETTSPPKIPDHPPLGNSRGPNVGAVSHFADCTGGTHVFPRSKKCCPMVIGDYSSCGSD